MVAQFLLRQREVVIGLGVIRIELQSLLVAIDRSLGIAFEQRLIGAACRGAREVLHLVLLFALLALGQLPLRLVILLEPPQQSAALNLSLVPLRLEPAGLLH